MQTVATKRAKKSCRIRRCGRISGILSDDKLVVLYIDRDRLAGKDAAGQDLLRNERFDRVLDIPAQGPRAELRVIGRVDDELLGAIRELAAQLLIRESLIERIDLQVDDARDICLRERLIEDDLVEPVEKLRAEGVVEQGVDLIFGCLRDFAVRPIYAKIPPST